MNFAKIFSVGYCMLVALGFQRILSHLNKNQNWKYFAVLLLVLTLGMSSGRLVLRNRVWASRETLFRWNITYNRKTRTVLLHNSFHIRSGLSSTINNGKVFYNYGNFLRDQEKKEEARICYKEALR